MYHVKHDSYAVSGLILILTVFNIFSEPSMLFCVIVAKVKCGVAILSMLRNSKSNNLFSVNITDRGLAFSEREWYILRTLARSLAR